MPSGVSVGSAGSVGSGVGSASTVVSAGAGVSPSGITVMVSSSAGAVSVLTGLTSVFSPSEALSKPSVFVSSPITIPGSFSPALRVNAVAGNVMKCNVDIAITNASNNTAALRAVVFIFLYSFTIQSVIILSRTPLICLCTTKKYIQKEAFSHS